MLQNILSELQKFVEDSSAGVPWSVCHVGGEHDTHVVFGVAVHGDEVGSLPAALRLLKELRDGTLHFGGRLTVFLGNIEAVRQGVRFLEQDLNRVFTKAAPESAEKKRAFELMPLLEKADVFFDFHQTREPCAQPFYTFGFQKESYLWARAAGGARVLCTRRPGLSFAGASVCCDEFVRQKGVPAVTLELGQRGFHANSERLAFQVMTRVLQIADGMGRSGRTIEQYAKQKEDLSFYEIYYRESFVDDGMKLKAGFKNFEQVEEGDVLGFTSGGEAFKAPGRGVLLFPKYPDRNPDGTLQGVRPSEIYNLAAPLPAHPLHLYRRFL